MIRPDLRGIQEAFDNCISCEIDIPRLLDYVEQLEDSATKAMCGYCSHIGSKNEIVEHLRVCEDHVLGKVLRRMEDVAKEMQESMHQVNARLAICQREKEVAVKLVDGLRSDAKWYQQRLKELKG